MVPGVISHVPALVDLFTNAPFTQALLRTLVCLLR